MKALACGLVLAVTALAHGQECAVLERQMNQHAGQLALACHLSQAPVPPGEAELLPPAAPPLLGTTDHDVILGGEGVYSHVTQSETQAAMSGTTRVIAYNDSSNAGASPRCYVGGSVSRDSGATWTKLPASAFCSGGHGDNFGDPFVLHDNRHAVWVAGFIVTGCGAQGLGAWRSGDGVTWTVGSCIHSGTGDDRESAAVDNSPSSPFFGRIYVSWNAFGDVCPPEGCDVPGGGSIFVTHSDDGGVSWSTPVQVTLGFLRDVQITTDAAGHVVIALMDEGGGGLACRRNWFARSSDGGQTWTVVPTGTPFTPSGRFTCGYFGAAFPSYWREEGWGDVGGAQGVVHYAFASGQSDASDVFYIRSTDGGVSWSAPVRLNSDTSGRLQWQPSIAVSPAGHVLVSWYDQRQTTGTSYERWGRLSTDNGLTWGPDEAISDAPSPLPAQVDGAVQPCYAGDYDRGAGDGSAFTVPWVDGRVAINGVAQQDVWTDSVTDTVTSGSTLPTVNLACVTTSTIATTTTTTMPPNCGTITPIPSGGGTITASTSGTSGLFGGCGDGGINAPERAFSWTPTVSGVATMTTCGGSTNFDTILYVRRDVCTTGAEVACNDDAGCTPSLASRVTPTVTAGVQYFIIVDGFGGSSGTFTLTVTPPGGGTTTTTQPATTTTQPSATTTSTTTSTTSTTLDPCIRNPHPRRCRQRFAAS